MPRRLARLNRSVERALSNAEGVWNGGHAFSVVYDCSADEGFMPDAVTAVSHTVSMCVANAPGIAEGSMGLRINGQACTVMGAVVPDASGWATFPVQFAGGANAGA